MSETDCPDIMKFTYIVDIGTTTIKAALCSEDGCPVAETRDKNSQSVFGTDVVSRILSAHYKGVQPLQKVILQQLISLLESLCHENNCRPESVSQVIITGNTVMLHLARGLSVQGFEMAPFTPVTLDEAEIPAGQLFAGIDPPCQLSPDTSVYFPPCIDAFIGADAVCAALYTATDENECTCYSRSSARFPLLIADVGTNTEIILMKDADGPVICCSTAAGPAFENGVPGSHCTGSSLVHLLSELLKSGAMDETGLLDETTASKVCVSGIPVITQDTVRQLQLAKGAVAAAIETLLAEEKLSVNDVASFVLCGNFGSALDVKEAECIGLFPAGLADVTEYAGNAAEKGARFLVDGEMRKKAKKIAAASKLIQLADSRFFARRYIERMNF